MQTGKHFSWPTAGDRGSQFGPVIETAFNTLDTHNHDGLNSEKLAPTNVAKHEEILATANWAQDGEEYKQTFNLPSGYAYDTSLFKFIIASGSLSGIAINPTVTKVTASQIIISCSQGDFDLKVVVG